MNVISLIHNIILTLTAILGVTFTWLSYGRQKKYNLVSISITIIDDNSQSQAYWYIRFSMKNCQKTIEYITLKIESYFSIASYELKKEVSDVFNISIDKNRNIILLSNVSSEDGMLFCLAVNKEKSNDILKKYDQQGQINNFNAIMQMKAKDIALKQDFLNYSQIYYAESTNHQSN